MNNLLSVITKPHRNIQTIRADYLLKNIHISALNYLTTTELKILVEYIQHKKAEEVAESLLMDIEQVKEYILSIRSKLDLDKNEPDFKKWVNQLINEQVQ